MKKRLFGVLLLLAALALTLTVAAHAENGRITVTERTDVNGVCTVEATLSGDPMQGTVYAAVYSSKGQMTEVKHCPAADTVRFTLENVGENDRVRLIWMGSDGQPAAEAITVPRTVAAWAILYSDGSMVFQDDAAPAEGKTVVAVYPIDGGEYRYDFASRKYTTPWYDRRKEITSVKWQSALRPASTAYWFYDCEKLEQADLAALDTSNVTNMSDMFVGCYALTALDVSGWDTSKGTDMRYMFGWCTALTALDISGWDTSKATSMSYMFYNC